MAKGETVVRNKPPKDVEAKKEADERKAAAVAKAALFLKAGEERKQNRKKEQERLVKDADSHFNKVSAELASEVMFSDAPTSTKVREQFSVLEDLLVSLSQNTDSPECSLVSIKIHGLRPKLLAAAMVADFPWAKLISEADEVALRQKRIVPVTSSSSSSLALSSDKVGDDIREAAEASYSFMRSAKYRFGRLSERLGECCRFYDKADQGIQKGRDLFKAEKEGGGAKAGDKRKSEEGAGDEEVREKKEKRMKTLREEMTTHANAFITCSKELSELADVDRTKSRGFACASNTSDGVMSFSVYPLAETLKQEVLTVDGDDDDDDDDDDEEEEDVAVSFMRFANAIQMQIAKALYGSSSSKKTKKRIKEENTIHTNTKTTNNEKTV